MRDENWLNVKRLAWLSSSNCADAAIFDKTEGGIDGRLWKSIGGTITAQVYMRLQRVMEDEINGR